MAQSGSCSEGRHPEAPRFHQRGEGSGVKYFKLTHYPNPGSGSMIAGRLHPRSGKVRIVRKKKPKYRAQDAHL
jgi:hypothetical protein